jgi:prepilin-type N-terminal cleavage/methylation domain-containing protein
MLIINQNKEKGFTLIELLVSIALFSVVLVVTLGSIITIADSNKKARSLMSVMNNLNFSIDSMTRSIKTGDIIGTSIVDGSGNCLITEQINYNDVSNEFARETVQYCFAEDAITGIGSITKQIESGAKLEITSPDVDVNYINFKSYVGSGNQPRVSIIIDGTVKVSEKISSSFIIQTTIAQRRLNI